MGRRAKGLSIRAADRPPLEPWARSQTLPHRQVQRARIVLALAAKKSLVQVATEVGVVEATVTTWRNRYEAEGLDGLRDRPRSGCPPTYTAADRDAQWSLSLRARATGISQAHWPRWWAEAAVQPHRTRTFKRSHDPQFEAKVGDVVGLYPQKDARRSRAVLRGKTPDPGPGTHPGGPACDRRPCRHPDP